jgi:hypothetical protein
VSIEALFIRFDSFIFIGDGQSIAAAYDQMGRNVVKNS